MAALALILVGAIAEGVFAHELAYFCQKFNLAFDIALDGFYKSRPDSHFMAGGDSRHFSKLSLSESKYTPLGLMSYGERKIKRLF